MCFIGKYQASDFVVYKKENDEFYDEKHYFIVKILVNVIDYNFKNCRYTEN